MTAQETSAIKKIKMQLITILIGTFIANIGGVYGFYYKTTYAIEEHAKRIDKLESNTVKKDVFELFRDDIDEMKSDIKELVKEKKHDHKD